MNFEGGRHCKIIRSIGVPLGLWPYRCTILGRMNGALGVTIIVLLMAAQLHDDLSGTVIGVFNSGRYLQLAVFTTHEFSGDLFFKIVTGIVPCIAYLSKYFVFMWKMDQVKYVLEWIQCDYDSLTNERELRLIEKFADRGTRIVKSILYCATFAFVPLGYPLLSVFFNIETSVNQSRLVLIPFKVEHFVDQDRYFYWIMFHIEAAMVLGVCILFVTESTFVHFTIHACGLLQIVGITHFIFYYLLPVTVYIYAYSEGKYSHIYRDRVERVFESSVPTDPRDKRYLAMNGQLVATIKLHQRVLEFIEYLNSTFLSHYCVLIAFALVTFAVNLYTLARAMLLRKITADMFTALSVVMVEFFYLGCGNYISQILLDKGNELFTNTYYARWHDAPLPVQKMLLYIRQRSMDPAGLEFGGLYTGSFEFFSQIVNTSMSYFTVLYSTT